MENIRLGELLVKYGYINDKQLQEALDYQKENTQYRIGDILIHLGFVTESQRLEALASRLQLQKVNVNVYKIDIKAVELLPKAIAIKYGVLPLEIKNNVLVIAVNDPLNYYAIEDIKLITNMHLEIVLSELESILSKAEYFYSEIEVGKIAISAYSKDETPSSMFEELSDTGAGESVVIKTVNTLLIKGYNANASDIHIEPFEEHTKIRIRIDGMMIDYLKLNSTFHQSIIARLKILSHLDIAEKRLPQDGHFKTEIDGILLNIRTSVIPTIHGEKMVLRFLTTNTTFDSSETLGMSDEVYKKFSAIMQGSHGLIYITGPTGSGKTTTLYMMIEKLKSKAINISTIEDPVEKNIQDVNQMQVNVTSGLTFESGLRAILRQDPDIIMVGETRDTQTAQISVKSAITGHLVLSTLHTNDALSTVVRLQDMGIEPYLVANSVVGVVAQRLVRKICPYCKEEYTALGWEKKILKDPVTTLHRGKGCHICNGTGYKGRIAIHEVAHIDAGMRNLIVGQAPMAEMNDYITKTQGMVRLFDSGIQLVKEGVTTVEELLKL